MRTKPAFRRQALALACVLLIPAACAAQNRGKSCVRLVLSGQVHAGAEWRAPIGEGWIFRVVPIAGGEARGWDLVVDRDPPAGYPDALLLATPPYNSMNEREVGTTWGLRAQDALGWNPRSFHFLIDPAALRDGQALFAELMQAMPPSGAQAGSAERSRAEAARLGELTRRLMVLDDRAAAGQFRILDARLTPGIADPAPYARNWALNSQSMQQTVVPAANGKATPLGEFHWIKFAITLWLPAGWNAPKGAQTKIAQCE